MTSSLFFSKTNNLGFHSEFKKKNFSLSWAVAPLFESRKARARKTKPPHTRARGRFVREQIRREEELFTYIVSLLVFLRRNARKTANAPAEE